MFNVAAMSANHLFYIPLVAFFGIALGYTLGAKSVRAELERQRERLKD